MMAAKQTSWAVAAGTGSFGIKIMGRSVNTRSVIGENGLVACHECDHLHQVTKLPVGGKALCVRCGALLYQHIPNSIDRSLALYLAALMLLIIANSFPFLSLKLSGRIEENILISGAWALYQSGMPELGLLVFLTSIFFPLITILGMLYLLIPARLGLEPPAKGPVYRLVNALTPWSLVGIFMLGVLIAIVKLQDLATIIPGISLFALLGWLIISTAARANFEPSVLWPHTVGNKVKPETLANSAREYGLTSCHNCSHLAETASLHHHSKCPRCSSPLHTRKHNSMARTGALIFTAAMLLIPANLYPIMTVVRFGRGEPDTIYTGVVHLVEGGFIGLALIVFFASIFVPVLKLIVLSLLLITVQKDSSWRRRDRTLLYRVTEIVGTWSMVDIFLVGLLAALVNLDALATIRPGIGATFFAAAIITTLFAAHSFDPRLIWDKAE